MNQTEIDVESASETSDWMNQTEIDVESASEPSDWMNQTEIDVESASETSDWMNRGLWTVRSYNQSNARAISSACSVKMKMPYFKMNIYCIYMCERVCFLF